MVDSRQRTLDVPEKTIDAVTRELQALGVERGAVVEVHTSFRAVRPIQDGPLGLIQALRARAQKELGDKFALQRFHVEFMKQGTIAPGYFGDELLEVLKK